MTDTRTRVHAVISNALCLVGRPVTDDATFASLGADSLDGIEIAMDLEDEFGLHIGDDTITEATTVGEAVAAVEALLV